MTEQRQVILEEVLSSMDHPTADEIYDRVKKRLPRVSLGTVYRNLDVLASMGMIRKIEPIRVQMRFESNQHDHYHLTCIRCGRIEDLAISPSESPMELLESVTGNLTKYGVFGHKLDFVGLCSECKGEGYSLSEDPEEDLDQEEPEALEEMNGTGKASSPPGTRGDAP